MDYRKIIVYVLIVIIAAALWYRSKDTGEASVDSEKRFIEVYAGTAVVAEIYRDVPERFFRARDSIYALYNFDADSVAAFEKTFEGREGDWAPVWNTIRNKVDSMVTYIKDNPSLLPVDSLPSDADSLRGD